MCSSDLTATAGVATQLTIHAGATQSGTVGTAVATPPAVLVRDQFDNPTAGVPVLFAVASGNGLVNPTTAVITDANGIAAVTSWTLGTTAGPNTLTAAGTGKSVTFAATGTAGDATQVTIHAGDMQVALAGTAVAIPPSVLLTDAFSNPVSGVPVTFAATSGGSTVDPTTPVTTKPDGVAAVTSWTLGAASGSNTLTATAPGVSSLTFTATVPPVADPTQLPVAAGQPPDRDAYDALDVRNQPAGFSYSDPVTGVKVWKLTSSTVPSANTGAGHDYSEGPNEISLGWGPNMDTHTILVRGDNSGAALWYVVDFTRGLGFSNYRLLTVQPRRDICATFSNLSSQPHILYISTGSEIVRYNTATMQTENTGNFPLAINAFSWLHHDKNDTWFTGVLGDEATIWAWNSQTNQYLTHYESWTNEPHLERDGRYVVLTSGGPYTTTRVWDLWTNTFGPVQDSSYAYHVSHNASARGHWIAEDGNHNPPFEEDRYDVMSGPQLARTTILGNSGGDAHHAGQWIQSDAELGGDLLKQWTYLTSEADGTQPWYDPLAWKLAVGLQRSDGSDQRLLLHHYSAPPYPAYYDAPWGQPSPDGKLVIFNSNMNNSGGRYDLFVAEVPLR